MKCWIFYLLWGLLRILSITTQPLPPAPLPALRYPPSISQTQFHHSTTGEYYYYYDTGSNGPVSFRGERRDMAGAVSGFFGYIDPDGVMRITHYTADFRGYRSFTTLRYLQTAEE